VPLFGVLLAQWIAGERDPFAAPEFRPGQIVAWLAGFCLYQWLSPVGPHWWTSLVEHTHPGYVSFTASLPAFGASFAIAAIAALRYRRRPGLASAEA